MDNTLYQTPAGNSSNGSGPGMFVGAISRGGAIRRAVIFFDIAGAVPAGATVTGVDLTLTCNRAHGGATNINVQRLLADWGEGPSDAGDPAGGGGVGAMGNDATWLFRHFTLADAWTNPGGDFVSTVSATRSVGATGAYTWASTAGLVADAQMWLDSPSQNFGWILKSTSESSPGIAKRFATREATTPSQRPSLRITYTIPAPGVASMGLGLVFTGLRRRRR